MTIREKIKELNKVEDNYVVHIANYHKRSIKNYVERNKDNEPCYVDFLIKSYAHRIEREFDKEIIDIETETTESSGFDFNGHFTGTQIINVYTFIVKRLSNRNKGHSKVVKKIYKPLKKGQRFVL